GIGTGGSPRCQEATRGSIDQTRSERVPTPPHDLPLSRVNTLESDEGSMQLKELMALCTKLSNRVLALETDLRQTKKVYGATYTKLIMKVKKLEKTIKSNQARRRAKIVVSHEEEDSEDSSKQGRIIEEIDQDAGITLVTLTKDSSQEDQPEDQLGVLSVAKKNVNTYTRRRRAVSTGSGGVSTASRLFSTAKESVSTASALMPVTAGMVEETKRTKIQLEQERLGHEAAVRLQEELDEEERQRMARFHEAAQSFTEEEWENIRARVEADEELSRRLQAEERNKYSEVDQAKMLHMGSHTLQQLKRYSFDELKELFETTMKNGSTFIPMETEDRERASELAAGSSQATITNSAEVGSSKRDAEAELVHEGSKKQTTNETSGSVKEQPEEEETELSQEDLQQMMMVVPVEEVYVEALQVK
ncbi:hypothetical protein Tco_1061557, partial [Tanacetum coccineum]